MVLKSKARKMKACSVENCIGQSDHWLLSFLPSVQKSHIPRQTTKNYQLIKSFQLPNQAAVLGYTLRPLAATS